jgi:DNA phosphorothioation-dependent restriction protein DptG
MRYLMFTGNDDRTEVHRYSYDEVTEVFGKAAPALDAMGFLNTRRGIWVDMEHAAKKRNWEDFTS